MDQITTLKYFNVIIIIIRNINLYIQKQMIWNTTYIPTEVATEGVLYEKLFLQLH